MTPPPSGEARLRPVAELTGPVARSIRGVFCDVDDTLTHRGRLVPDAFEALSALRRNGLRVVPVTGRPAGWVDQIARLWPVDGVVGENGGLWFWKGPRGLERRFLQGAEERRHNRERLAVLGERILAEVPGTALASDQPYRELDLAIDFCEDVEPLGEASIDAIVDLFRSAGATCKVSSIHVNGWFGQFDKWTGCTRLAADLWDEDLWQDRERWAYFGDSANDEPMFERFGLSIGVANVRRFLPRMKTWPRWITDAEGGDGFAEGVDILLARRGAVAT